MRKIIEGMMNLMTVMMTLLLTIINVAATDLEAKQKNLKGQPIGLEIKQHQ